VFLPWFCALRLTLYLQASHSVRSSPHPAVHYFKPHCPYLQPVFAVSTSLNDSNHLCCTPLSNASVIEEGIALELDTI
jgi:hypothetical protein